MLQAESMEPYLVEIALTQATYAPGIEPGRVAGDHVMSAMPVNSEERLPASGGFTSRRATFTPPMGPTDHAAPSTAGPFDALTRKRYTRMVSGSSGIAGPRYRRPHR
jgi:hypothetical protein